MVILTFTPVACVQDRPRKMLSTYFLLKGSGEGESCLCNSLSTFFLPLFSDEYVSGDVATEALGTAPPRAGLTSSWELSGVGAEN